MRAVLINPHAKTVSEIEVSPEEGGLTQALKTDPDYSGSFELTRLAPRLDLWTDEEANLTGGRPVWEIGGFAFTGVGVILGSDDKGDLAALASAFALAFFLDLVAWTDLVSSGDFGPTREEDVDHPIFGKTKAIITGQPVYIPRGLWEKRRQSSQDVDPEQD